MKSPCKVVYLDLGIEGDDAAELFDIFKREFKVDLSELHLCWER